MKSRTIRIIDTYRVDVYDSEVNFKLNTDEVLIKVVSSGICGSDLHYFRNAGLGRFRQDLPLSLGHEASGYVIDSKSKKFSLDEKVGIEPSLLCHSCKFCKTGKSNLCLNVEFLGANAPGALTDFLKVHESQLVKSDDYRFKDMALIEPFGVALHNYNLAKNLMGKNKFEKNVAIVGGGPIGVLIGIIVKNKLKDSNIKIFEPHEYRRNYLKNFFEENELSNIDLNKNEEKYDLIFEVSGTQNSTQLSESIVAPGGSLIYVGIPEVDNIIINPHKLRINEVTTIFSRRCSAHIDTIFDQFKIIDFDKDKFITDVFYADDAQKAFEVADSKNSLKVQLNFEDTYE